MISQAQVLLLATAATGAPAAADPAEPILVTGSRIDGATVAGTSRIEADEIRRLQPVSLLETLDDLAGVRAFSTGGVGGGTFLSVRGGEPNFTLVMIDGLKLNNPMNSRGGAFDLTLIDPALVQSLEVFRGSASAVHGSDALSGLVAIRLRDADRSGPRMRIEGGSEGETGLSLTAGEGWQGGAVTAAVSRFDSGGLDAGSDLHRIQALVRLRQRIGGFEGSALALHARADRRLFPEDSGGPLFAATRELETGETRLSGASISLHRAADAAVRPNLVLSASEQREAADTPAIPPGSFGGVPAASNRHRFARLEAIADLRFSLGPLAATAGAAWLHESGRSRGTLDLGFPLPVGFALERTTRSVFAEARLRPIPAVSFDLAGRIDAVGGGRDTSTGRAALRVALSPAGPALFASVGEGYKRPSFFALAHPLIGNPELRPERSLNAEAGVEWRRGSDGALRLALFHNRFRDLIDFDPAQFRLVNRARVEAEGIEAEAAWTPAPGLRLSAALTFLDLDSETPLRGRPRWQGAARIVWAPSPVLEVAAAVRTNGSFFDASIPTGLVRTAGHFEADLALRYRLSPSLILDAGLRNLGDSRHQHAVGFPAPPRRLRAALTADF